jgi:DNA-binding MarR family transcriptional regulator
MAAGMNGTGEVWARFARASRLINEAVEAEIREAGFPPLPWYEVLFELSRAPKGRLTPKDLEDRTLVAQYNLSRLLDRMEREGLVTRLPYPGDRRRQWVQITGTGRFLRKAIFPALNEAVERHFGERLSPDDASLLSHLISRMLREGASTSPGALAPPSSHARPADRRS